MALGVTKNAVGTKNQEERGGPPGGGGPIHHRTWGGPSAQQKVGGGGKTEDAKVLSIRRKCSQGEDGKTDAVLGRGREEP